LVAKSDQLAIPTLDLEFLSLITWDLVALVDDVVDWLNNPKDPETSKVCMLSSPQFLDLIQPFIEDDTRTQFHRMVYTISLTYTPSFAPSQDDLTGAAALPVASIAGHN
jgi:hypothetical protein